MQYDQKPGGWFNDFFWIAGPFVALALVALYLFVRFAS